MAHGFISNVLCSVIGRFEWPLTKEKYARGARVLQRFSLVFPRRERIRPSGQSTVQEDGWRHLPKPASRPGLGCGVVPARDPEVTRSALRCPANTGPLNWTHSTDKAVASWFTSLTLSAVGSGPVDRLRPLYTWHRRDCYTDWPANRGSWVRMPIQTTGRQDWNPDPRQTGRQVEPAPGSRIAQKENAGGVGNCLADGACGRDSPG
jgi:hypothetical protein